MPKRLTKIVCIDDETIFLDNLAEFLANSGYEVHKASNAAEGMELIIREEPDIVITDIRMPEQDGIGMICQMMYERANGNGLIRPRIIYLTAMDQPAYHIAARRVGCDDYLVKPIDFAVVIAAISAVEDKAVHYI